MKTLSKNLLRKYGIPKRTEQATGQATRSGGAQKDIGLGRKAMTQKKKDLIKTGSMILLGHKGAL